MGLRLTNHTQSIGASPSVHGHGHNRHGDDGLKLAFDFVAALLALIIFSPMILVFALLIRLQDGKSAFYHQVRFGQNGETFHCYKLRTMVANAQEELERLLASDPAARAVWEQNQKLTNDPRITALGAFLRKTSIDELPQLFNILKGEMSLVGPRPIVRDEVARYAENFEYYSSVRPGLTGLWQVQGRSDVSYPARVAMDVQYAKSRSFWGDVKIILLTVPAVFFSRGAR